MAAVIIDQREWQHIRIMSDLRDGAYHLQCGITVPINGVSKPYNIWASKEVVVSFADEKDAIWFILSHGGQIFSG